MISEKEKNIYKTPDIADHFREFYTKSYNRRPLDGTQDEDNRREKIREYILDANLRVLEQRGLKN